MKAWLSVLVFTGIFSVVCSSNAAAQTFPSSAAYKASAINTFCLKPPPGTGCINGTPDATQLKMRIGMAKTKDLPYQQLIFSVSSSQGMEYITCTFILRDASPTCISQCGYAGSWCYGVQPIFIPAQP